MEADGAEVLGSDVEEAGVGGDGEEEGEDGGEGLHLLLRPVSVYRVQPLLPLAADVVTLAPLSGSPHRLPYMLVNAPRGCPQPRLAASPVPTALTPQSLRAVTYPLPSFLFLLVHELINELPGEKGKHRIIFAG